MLPEGKYDCKNIGGETVEYRWNIEQTKRKLAWFSPPSSNDVVETPPDKDWIIHWGSTTDGTDGTIRSG